MKKKKTGKRTPTHAEWYEAHREQFERTDRDYEALKARWAREAAGERRPFHGDARA
jgi:hypothetical protein